jgi:prolyl-tRNA synthetase
MRTREFVMKDLYSFSKSIEEHEAFYKTCGEAYVRVFARAGIGDITFQTFASGGSFSKFSHEFQTLSSAGEDTIYLSRKRSLAVNEEVYTDEVLKEIGLEKSELTQEKSIEVGNIFSLGTRFSEAIGLTFRDEAGEERPVVMGSYGIGPGRLMGTIAETQSDQGGLVWPREVAPFQYHLITLPGEGNKAGEKAEALYRKMETQGLEVLFDDRGISAGEKFADADLIGIPSRLVISDKTVDAGKIELTDRKSGESRMVAEEELFS